MWWLALAACNRYDLFLVTGGEGTRRSDNAEVLFVVDNSDSMVEEVVALTENLQVFVDRLAGRTSGLATEGLEGAVDQYVAEAHDPGAAVDYQLAITTTDATNDSGRLLGTPPILAKGTPDITDKFAATLVCEAACFPNRGSVPSDPGFSCGEPFAGVVSQEYLDCTCGADAWVGACGSAAEEPIEAVYDAVCRALGDPPDSCFEVPSPVNFKSIRSNAGLVRDRTVVVAIVVTDEGDSSRRTPTVDPVPQSYVTLFDELGVDIVWGVVAPALNADLEPACPGPATSWGLLRFDLLVEDSGGVRIPIDGADCGATDWRRPSTGSASS